MRLNEIGENPKTISLAGKLKAKSQKKKSILISVFYILYSIK